MTVDVYAELPEPLRRFADSAWVLHANRHEYMVVRSTDESALIQLLQRRIAKPENTIRWNSPAAGSARPTPTDR